MRNKYDKDFEVPELVIINRPKPPPGYVFLQGVDWKDGEQVNVYYFRAGTQDHGPYYNKQALKTLANFHKDLVNGR